MLSELRCISKRLSYILRHDPEKFGITLDDEGWASIEEIERKAGIKKEDIYKVVEKQDKIRFEIKEGKIRALYGHSFIKIPYTSIEPPSVLFHGTTRENALRILKEGLNPMGRHYVHLSVSKKDALRVGLRKTRKPVIIKINASKAYKSGIEFYRAGDVYLTNYIPPEFLECLE